METRTLLDTHSIVWFYQNDLKKFPVKTLKDLEEDILMMSPIVSLELDLLHEIGRLKEGSKRIFEALREEIDLAMAPGSFEDVIKTARLMTWTRDPFDRLLVAHAHFLDAKLLTKDHKIRKNYPLSVWSS